MRAKEARLGILILLMLLSQEPEKHRGPAPAQVPLVIPMRGADVNQIDWGEIAAMMAVLGGISASVQWILIRAIIQPQIEKAMAKTNETTRLWAHQQFPSKSEFDLHAQKDSQMHERLEGMISDMATDQTQDSERLAILHDKVIILESHRNSGR